MEHFVGRENLRLSPTVPCSVALDGKLEKCETEGSGTQDLKDPANQELVPY